MLKPRMLPLPTVRGRKGRRLGGEDRQKRREPRGCYMSSACALGHLHVLSVCARHLVSLVLVGVR